MKRDKSIIAMIKLFSTVECKFDRIVFLFGSGVTECPILVLNCDFNLVNDGSSEYFI